MLTSAYDGGDEDVMHDALGEAQAQVAVVHGAGHAPGLVHLVKGHLWVLVEPGKRDMRVKALEMIHMSAYQVLSSPLSNSRHFEKRFKLTSSSTC